LTANLSVKSCI